MFKNKPLLKKMYMHTNTYIYIKNFSKVYAYVNLMIVVNTLIQLELEHNIIIFIWKNKIKFTIRTRNNTYTINQIFQLVSKNKNGFLNQFYNEHIYI